MIPTNTGKKRRDDPIVIDVPKPKRRQEHMPTRKEEDKSKRVPRKQKYKEILDEI